MSLINIESRGAFMRAGKRTGFISNKSSSSVTTEVVVLLITALLWLYLSLSSDSFFTINNIKNLSNQMAINGVIAIGVLFPIITGGIDLSLGSIIGITNVIMAVLITSKLDYQYSVTTAIITSLGIACVLGLINGILVFDLKLPPFIATLGMMIILRGVALIISEGRSIYSLPRSISDFANTGFLGIPHLFIILVSVVIAFTFVIKATTFGRYIFAIGSNEEAARLSGINTRLVIYGVYAIDGFLAGLGGVMITMRTWGGNPNAGTMFELDAIAAAVLGGASLSGAEGSPLGAFVGALFVWTIYNGCNLMGIDSNVTKVLVGAILIITVAVDRYRKTKQGDL